MTSTEFKSCCVALYEKDALQFLLGPVLHPGGLALTKRLAIRLRLRPTDRILDIACGAGESAHFLAREFQSRVVGIDLSEKLVQRANSLNRNSEQNFLVGDGEHLPIRDDSFTVVTSECSMCLMHRFEAGLWEAQRILRPGGRIGISDVAMNGQAPVELQNILSRFLCVSHNISSLGYLNALQTEGFTNVEVTDESQSLIELLGAIKKRFLLAEILSAIGKASISSEQLKNWKHLASLTEIAVKEGKLRYVMITGQKPNR